MPIITSVSNTSAPISRQFFDTVGPTIVSVANATGGSPFSSREYVANGAFAHTGGGLTAAAEGLRVSSGSGLERYVVQAADWLATAAPVRWMELMLRGRLMPAAAPLYAGTAAPAPAMRRARRTAESALTNTRVVQGSRPAPLSFLQAVEGMAGAGASENVVDALRCRLCRDVAELTSLQVESEHYRGIDTFNLPPCDFFFDTAGALTTARQLKKKGGGGFKVSLIFQRVPVAGESNHLAHAREARSKRSFGPYWQGVLNQPSHDPNFDSKVTIEAHRKVTAKLGNMLKEPCTQTHHLFDEQMSVEPATNAEAVCDYVISAVFAAATDGASPIVGNVIAKVSRVGDGSNVDAKQDIEEAEGSILGLRGNPDAGTSSLKIVEKDQINIAGRDSLITKEGIIPISKTAESNLIADLQAGDNSEIEIDNVSGAWKVKAIPQSYESNVNLSGARSVGDGTLSVGEKRYVVIGDRQYEVEYNSMFQTLRITSGKVNDYKIPVIYDAQSGHWKFLEIGLAEGAFKQDMERVMVVRQSMFDNDGAKTAYIEGYNSGRNDIIGVDGYRADMTYEELARLYLKAADNPREAGIIHRVMDEKKISINRWLIDDFITRIQANTQKGLLLEVGYTAPVEMLGARILDMSLQQLQEEFLYRGSAEETLGAIKRRMETVELIDRINEEFFSIEHASDADRMSYDLGYANYEYMSIPGLEPGSSEEEICKLYVSGEFGKFVPPDVKGALKAHLEEARNRLLSGEAIERAKRGSPEAFQAGRLEYDKAATRGYASNMAGRQKLALITRPEWTPREVGQLSAKADMHFASRIERSMLSDPGEAMEYEIGFHSPAEEVSLDMPDEEVKSPPARDRIVERFANNRHLTPRERGVLARYMYESFSSKAEAFKSEPDEGRYFEQGRRYPARSKRFFPQDADHAAIITKMRYFSDSDAPAYYAGQAYNEIDAELTSRRNEALRSLSGKISQSKRFDQYMTGFLEYPGMGPSYKEFYNGLAEQKRQMMFLDSAVSDRQRGRLVGRASAEGAESIEYVNALVDRALNSPFASAALDTNGEVKLWLDGVAYDLQYKRGIGGVLRRVENDRLDNPRLRYLDEIDDLGCRVARSPARLRACGDGVFAAFDARLGRLPEVGVFDTGKGFATWFGDVLYTPGHVRGQRTKLVLWNGKFYKVKGTGLVSKPEALLAKYRDHITASVELQRGIYIRAKLDGIAEGFDGSLRAGAAVVDSAKGGKRYAVLSIDVPNDTGGMKKQYYYGEAPRELNRDSRMTMTTSLPESEGGENLMRELRRIYDGSVTANNLALNVDESIIRDALNAISRSKLTGDKLRHYQKLEFLRTDTTPEEALLLDSISRLTLRNELAEKWSAMNELRPDGQEDVISTANVIFGMREGDEMALKRTAFREQMEGLRNKVYDNKKRNIAFAKVTDGTNGKTISAFPEELTTPGISPFSRARKPGGSCVMV